MWFHSITLVVTAITVYPLPSNMVSGGVSNMVSGGVSEGTTDPQPTIRADVTTFRPESMTDYSGCSVYGLFSLPESNLVDKFGVSSVADCWEYCQLEDTSCVVFTYHILNQVCGIYNSDGDISARSGTGLNVAVVYRDCIESIDPLFGQAHLVKYSQVKGVRIRNKFTGKCLAVSSDRVAWGGPIGYQLIWTANCRKGAVWTFHLTGVTLPAREPIELIRVTQFNTSWELAWVMQDEEGSPMAYLARSKSAQNNMTAQGFALVRYDHGESAYSIVAPIYNHDNGVYRKMYVTTNNATEDFNLNKALDNIKFMKGELPARPCRISQFAVTNSTVLNKEGVPYFLHGHTVTVRCREGYSADADSTEQEIVCGSEARPKQCKPDQGTDRKKYLAIIACLTSLLIVSVIFLPFKQINVCGFRGWKSVISCPDARKVQCDAEIQVHIEPATQCDTETQELSGTESHVQCDAKINM